MGVRLPVLTSPLGQPLMHDRGSLDYSSTPMQIFLKASALNRAKGEEADAFKKGPFRLIYNMMLPSRNEDFSSIECSIQHSLVPDL